MYFRYNYYKNTKLPLQFFQITNKSEFWDQKPKVTKFQPKSIIWYNKQRSDNVANACMLFTFVNKKYKHTGIQKFIVKHICPSDPRVNTCLIQSKCYQFVPERGRVKASLPFFLQFFFRKNILKKFSNKISFIPIALEQFYKALKQLLKYFKQIMYFDVNFVGINKNFYTLRFLECVTAIDHKLQIVANKNTILQSTEITKKQNQKKTPPSFQKLKNFVQLKTNLF
eukprot:TRINITY_DN5248_c1_g1_i1.p2 TRINITY_DN5248_c1_g1~~TRINITY_DN5248_c1_g1_i1.p2  ORF type:complete len:226 (-),score=-7.60 TRINITY_DN5248_c1_g1_i1:555-1232(-)